MCVLWRGYRKFDSVLRIFFLSELDERTAHLAQEAYNLVKHGGFTYRDVLGMTAIERDEFMKLLIDENQREKEALSSLNT